MNENVISTKDVIILRLGFSINEVPLAEWPKEQNIKYLIAPEVEEIGKQLINKFRVDLKGYNIAYLFKEKAQKKDSGTVLGAIKIESELQKTLHGYDTTMIIGFDEWVSADPDSKFRLVYHELQHLIVGEKSSKLETITHTVEEFPEVIRIFGPGTLSQVEFINAYNYFRDNN